MGVGCSSSNVIDDQSPTIPEHERVELQKQKWNKLLESCHAEFIDSKHYDWKLIEFNKVHQYHARFQPRIRDLFHLQEIRYVLYPKVEMRSVHAANSANITKMEVDEDWCQLEFEKFLLAISQKIKLDDYSYIKASAMIKHKCDFGWAAMCPVSEQFSTEFSVAVVVGMVSEKHRSMVISCTMMNDTDDFILYGQQLKQMKEENYTKFQ